MFNRHASVLTRGNTWHTVSVEDTFSKKYVEEACDIHILSLAKDTITKLKKRTTGIGAPKMKHPQCSQLLNL